MLERSKAVEKFALLERIKLKHTALRASTGTFSDFIQIYMYGEPNTTWDALKKNNLLIESLMVNMLLFF